MSSKEIVEFLWQSISSGVTGNAAYEGVKGLLGNAYERLLRYKVEKRREEFDDIACSILETNETLHKKILELATGQGGQLNQYHSGVGDNVGRDKIVYQTPDPVENLKINITLLDGIEIFEPIHEKHDCPVFIIGLSNKGKVLVHVSSIGVILNDGREGSFMMSSLNIEEAKGNVFIVPEGRNLTVSTNETLKGTRGIIVAHVIPLLCNDVSAITVETYAKGTYTVFRKDWDGVIKNSDE